MTEQNNTSTKLFFDVPIKEMPYGGIFYPQGWKMQVRAAIGEEIAYFSSIDPESFDVFDVFDAYSNVFSRCLRIFDANGVPQPWNRLLEFDKIWMLLYIRHITLPNPENNLTFEDRCEKGHVNTVSLDHTVINCIPLSEFALQHFDRDLCRFVVETKSFGKLVLQPSTFRRTQLFKEFVLENPEVRTDKLFGKLYWMFINDDNENEKDAMKNAYARFVSAKHSNKLLSIYLKLSKDLETGIDKLITYQCKEPGCGLEVRTPIRFPGGLENILVDTSISSEFL